MVPIFVLLNIKKFFDSIISKIASKNRSLLLQNGIDHGGFKMLFN